MTITLTLKFRVRSLFQLTLLHSHHRHVIYLVFPGILRGPKIFELKLFVVPICIRNTFLSSEHLSIKTSYIILKSP